jgi:hypothetical protein
MFASGDLSHWAQFAFIKVGLEALCGLKVFLETNLGDY